ncbi:hypothetical protein HG537_0H02970 [Torulaspora globosa]|uniref:JmjC domain-containing protein n=1 Tax=Torulaspora globosa TaxID=48254 RepID=A0A7H9I0X8_9SACH|nr:hypothetical protein HG537_0H02970 [Torulaspora sp. CBS 2947]
MNIDHKRRQKSPNYRINQHAIAPIHPLGVKPSGNALLFSNREVAENSRKRLLGNLVKLPEHLLVEILSYIAQPNDLKNLGHSSRILYAYCYNDEYWRNLYMREYRRLESTESEGDIKPFGRSKWRGSWRKTLLNIDEESLIQTNSLVFSDLLYRPFQCSNIDYRSLFAHIIEYEKKSSELCHTLNAEFGVERFRESSFTLKEFQTKWIDRPFILQRDSDQISWPKWEFDDLLRLFPNEQFRQEAVQWDLPKYLEYAKNNCDESPLYLFDCKDTSMTKISELYEAPNIFSDDAFKLFQKGQIQCRPDHRWLISGPTRSGSTFHKDPNHTSAWNAVLSGMKLWIMLPPDVPAPGVSTDKEEEEVTAPIGISEWILSGFYNDAVKLAANGKCLITVTFPGECIYVPSRWWHSVINITDCVAITENFVPEPLLTNVLSFLKNKPTHISGFHMKDVATSISEFLCNVKEKEIRSTVPNYLPNLEAWRLANKDREYDNEDCGVDCKSANTIPIYEFFVELLKRSEHKDAAEEAVNELLRLEQAKVTKIRESEKWNELRKGNNQQFSFSFSLD